MILRAASQPRRRGTERRHWRGVLLEVLPARSSRHQSSPTLSEHRHDSEWRFLGMEDLASDEGIAPLEPSKLGTREYWDAYYQNDLANEASNEDPIDPSDLESWFDDVGAPAKILEYLTSASFPLSQRRDDCSVLDLGTGNGSALFTLRHEGDYKGPLVGVDYSEQSVRLANRLKTRYASALGSPQHINVSNVTFDVFDLISQKPDKAPWWPPGGTGFDLVLDKGTFDAISLTSDTVMNESGVEKRMNEVYPSKAAALIKPGGYLLITSCNWTEDELVNWFTTTADVRGVFQVLGKIKYKAFEFGGRKGQGVATICFQKRT